MKDLFLRLTFFFIAFLVGQFGVSCIRSVENVKETVTSSTTDAAISSEPSLLPSGLQAPPTCCRLTPSGIDSDEEGEQFWLDFQKAITTNDREATASLLNYPLNVNFPTDSLKKNYRKIYNSREFLRLYDKIFDGPLIELIANTSKDDIWGNYNGIATPRGEIWLGVYCVGKESRTCGSGYQIRVRTIHGSSVFIDR